MYTSTPHHLSPSLFFIIFFPYPPFSFRFLTLPPPLVFVPLFPSFPLSLSSFPSSLLLSSSPLFPPCFPVTSISIFCLFPLLHPPLLLISFFLSSLPFAPYNSPPSLLLLSPSSLEILQLCLLPVFHPLLPPFLLSSNICTRFITLSYFSPYLFSKPHISCSLSPSSSPPSIAFFFPSLASYSHLSPSKQALHVKFIFFIFSLSRPQLSPLLYIHCLHLPHSTKNSSLPYPPSPLFLLLISLTQTIKIPTFNQFFPKLPTKFGFPPKMLPTLILFAPKTVLNAPNILFPLRQLTSHKSQTIHKTDNIQDTQQTHLQSL